MPSENKGPRRIWLLLISLALLPFFLIGGPLLILTSENLYQVLGCQVPARSVPGH